MLGTRSIREQYHSDLAITVSRRIDGHIQIHYTDYSGEVTTETFHEFERRQRRDVFVRRLIDRLTKAGT